MDKYTGKKLDGRYEIRELIGVGGMANVYLCYDTIDDREVAIKILKDEFLNNDDFIRRFKNESKAIAVLSHPNIVKVIDVSFGDMIQYIVMEYIDGITLKEYIALQGVIDWKETLHLTTQILKALQHAHENGIIHRDIKPQNIMLLQDGTIKVTDFGIARFSSTATRTMTEHAIGSVHYIAPEQARGEMTDGKADIYSVGVMMYEMLTGKLPFEADSAVSVALMQLQTTPKRPREINPSIPDGLEQITIKAMQKDTAQRYQSALDMLNDIERFRLNPSIVFEYKYFVDSEPTKYVGSLNKKSANRNSGYNDSYSKKSESEEYMIDEFADEDENEKPKTAQSVLKGVGLALILCLLVFGSLALFRGCSSASAQDVDIPNYVGKQLAQVQSENGNKFVLVYENDFDENQELGVILSQDPEAGSKKVKEGSTITLTVNSTDNEVKAPYILNESEADAIKAIQARNLTPEILYIADTETTVGYVADVYPKAGVEVNIGSTIYVFVSKGAVEDMVTIEDVTGYSYTMAKQKLEEKGLLVEYKYDNESTKPKDEVIQQTPLQGGSVQKGYTVYLILSGEKKETKEVPITVDLPTGEQDSVYLRVTVDGVVDEINSKNVIPKYNNFYYTFKVEGTSTNATVVVDINNKVYREYTVNFQTQQVTNTKTYPYEPETEPATDPPTTEPATMPPTTQPTEPTTDEPTSEEYEQ